MWPTGGSLGKVKQSWTRGQPGDQGENEYHGLYHN